MFLHIKNIQYITYSFTAGTSLLSHGATCKNWAWSWAFVNHENRSVIFGAWDENVCSIGELILDIDWKYGGKNNRKKSAFPEALEYIGLIEKRRYSLYTFSMIYSERESHENGDFIAKIGGFDPVLRLRYLYYENGKWYAVNILLSEIVSGLDEYIEGEKKEVLVNSYERNPMARAACLLIHGLDCKICGLNFKKIYGDIGEGFIHVHHLSPAIPAHVLTILIFKHILFFAVALKSVINQYT